MYSIWYFLYMPVRKQPSHNSGASSCTVRMLNSRCRRQWPLCTLLITAVFNRFMWNVIIFIFQILLYYTCSSLGIWFKFDYTTHAVLTAQTIEFRYFSFQINKQAVFTVASVITWRRSEVTVGPRKFCWWRNTGHLHGQLHEDQTVLGLCGGELGL